MEYDAYMLTLLPFITLISISSPEGNFAKTRHEPYLPQDRLIPRSCRTYLQSPLLLVSQNRVELHLDLLRFIAEVGQVSEVEIAQEGQVFRSQSISSGMAENSDKFDCMKHNERRVVERSRE